nr:hypothetical protein [Mycoplasmopsis agalactiae]
MADLENKTVKANVESKPAAAKTQSVSAPKRTESGAKKQIWEKEVHMILKICLERVLIEQIK